MLDNNKENISEQEEQEINIKEILLKIWNARKWILKWCGIALIVGLIIGFSIPKEYTTKVVIAPEISDKNKSGLSSLAGLAGINLSSPSGADAIYPDLYPDIVSSNPFLINLLDTHIQDLGNKIDTTLYCYMDDYLRGTWWSYITKAKVWFISLFKNKVKDKDKDNDEIINPFHLTKKEASIVKGLKNRINVSVNSKTGITTLSVTMQDPLVSAQLANAVMLNLKDYVTEYRTNKAKEYFEFQQKLFERKKQEYEKAQEKYAAFVDANKNIILSSYKVEQERLENERNLTFQVYLSVTQQLQIAEAKVQEITPVFTILDPPTVPLVKSKPSKVKILFIVIFITIILCITWIFFLKPFISDMRNKEKKYLEDSTINAEKDKIKK